MSENLEQAKVEITSPEAEESLKEAIVPALITMLKTWVYFLILPYKIWKTTTIRLARSSTNGGAIVRDGEQFPVYTFYRVSLDATIFFMGLISVPLVLAAGAGFFIYIFVIPFLSFLNEILSMSLVSTQSLVKIDENTQK